MGIGRGNHSNHATGSRNAAWTGEKDVRWFQDRCTTDRRGCWILRKVAGNGYGRMYFRGRKMQSHRVSFVVFRGTIPSHLNVLHRCDNRACVNPDHLWLGTQSDNLRDAIVKGRPVGRPRKPTTTAATTTERRNGYGS